MRRAILALVFMVAIASVARAENFYPGVDFQETNGLYDSADILEIAYSGNEFFACTIGGAINIDIAGGDLAVTMKNVAVPGPVTLVSGDIINATNCAFEQTEAQIEADGGVVNATGCIFDVADFGFVGGGSYALLPTSVLVDAGSDLTADGVVNDILSNPRPAGDQFDIGCYELQGSEFNPGENFEEVNGLYDSGDTLNIGYAGNVYRNCTIDGAIDIDISGGNVAVTMKNVAVPGTVTLAPGDIINATNCAFAQTEEQIEAAGGVITWTGCTFGVADFGFIGSGSYDLLKTSVLINAGTNLAAEGVSADLLYRQRPSGAAFDIGCYEYRFKLVEVLKQ